MILGFFDLSRRGPTPVPKVRLSVFLPGGRAPWAAVDFLIDTGAATTCIHPLDATTRLGIPMTDLQSPANWPRIEVYRGIGGSGNYYVVPAEYGFTHDDGSFQTLRGQVRIAQPHPHNQALESLLGWDVLQHFRLVTDWPSRRIEFHAAPTGRHRRRP